MRQLFYLSLFALCSIHLQAQFLINPSFEGHGLDNIPPVNWDNCTENSSPDNPPLPERILIELPASHGQRYLSMRARGDIPNPEKADRRGVRDDVSTRLLTPLEQGKSYNLSIDLATDYEVLFFEVVSTMEPVQLRIWAGNDYCEKEELLASSGPVDNTNWETFQICFSPQMDSYTWFFLEADYIDNDTTNGIVLVDNLIITEEGEIEVEDVLTEEVRINTPYQLEATENDSYWWFPSDQLSCNFCQSPIAMVTEDISYTVQLTNAGDCPRFERFNLIAVECELTDTIYYGVILDTIVDFGFNIELTAPQGETYHWLPESSISCHDCKSPIATPPATTNYSCIVTDNNSCVKKFDYNIEVNLKIPNTITPNYDGINDNFIIEGLPDNSQLKIIDRLGNLVFETDNYENNWPISAMYTISKQTDTYWYLLECEGHPPYKGFIFVKF